MNNVIDKPALDSRWYYEYRYIMSLVDETYISLLPPQETLNSKRLSFELSDYKRNPSLVATHLNPAHFVNHNNKLVTLKSNIEKYEKNRLIRNAYHRCIDEAIAKNNICIASSRNDAAAFKSANFMAYGEPNIDIFRGAIGWIRADAISTFGGSPLQVKHKNSVLNLLPKVRGNVWQFLPTSTTYRNVRKIHFKRGGYFDQIFGAEGLPKLPIITRDIGDSICYDVLSRLGLQYQLTDSHDGIWGVDQKSKQIVRPPEYTMAREDFIGLVCHEIGSHLLESINGAKQPLLLLQTGLDRYERGNEGRALMREQIIHEDPAEFLSHPAWEYGVIKHVLICLANGLHRHRYNFCEIYELAFALFSFWRERRFPGDPDNETKARDEAWHATARVLKGTDGNGGAYVKDIVYLEGNIRCWRVARFHPEMTIYGDIGKFDISNRRHLWILGQLGILRPIPTTVKSRFGSIIRAGDPLDF